MLAAAVGLAGVPAGDAAAATTGCTWQQHAWQFPAGADAAELHGYDGSRYAVGLSGTRSIWVDGVVDPHPTLWDNGTVVWRSPDFLPYVNDVNSSGVIAGADLEGDNKSFGITIARDGTVKRLPSDPGWDQYGADLIDNKGDIVGSAIKPGLQYVIVVWPADAPGTYRELPGPTSGPVYATDLDEQGEILGVQGAPQGAIWTTSGGYHLFETPQFADPESVRNGHVVGGWSTFSTYGAAEWDAQGHLTRSIPGTSVVKFTALGGGGTVGGVHFVGSQEHPALWRDGVLVDPLDAVGADFDLQWISDDDHSLVGVDDLRPMHYRCT